MPIVGIMADSDSEAAAGPPATISGLELWLDASVTATITHSSGAVSQWNDRSGKGRHHTQTTAGWKPITGTRTLNSLNVIDFDGTDDNLAYTFLSVINQPVTIAAVVQADATPAAICRFYGRAAVGTTFNLGMSTTSWHYSAGTSRSWPGANTSPHVLMGIFNNPSSSLLLDGTVVATTDPGTAGITAAAHSCGAGVTAVLPFNGVIGEILIYSQALSGANLTTISSYLRTKWGTP